MERCSNCGAAARIGAKFCTTCGYRLQSDYASETAATDNDGVASNQSETAAAAQPAATATEPDTGWPVPPDDAAAQPTDPDSTATAADDTTGAEAGDAVAASADQQSSAERNDAPSADASASDGESETGTTADPHSASDDAADVSTSDVTVADEVISSSWPPPDETSWSSSWDTSATSADTLNTGTDTATDDESSTVATTNEVVETTDDVSDTWWSDSSQAAGEPIAESTAVSEPSGELDTGRSPSTLDEPETASSFMVAERESASVISDSDEGQQGSALTARALDLVDELRALLPTLSAGTGGEQSTIASDLELALAGDAAITGDQSGLRDVLETAREHPRSVDSVLALSGRVEEIIALLDRHDRLVRAMEQAISTLHNEPASSSRND